MPGVTPASVADLCLARALGSGGGLRADVRLVGGDGESVRAHRIVLAPVSALVEAALKAVETEGEDEATVLVPDLSGREIEEFLYGLYRVMKQVRSCINFSSRKIVDFLFYVLTLKRKAYYTVPTFLCRKSKLRKRSTIISFHRNSPRNPGSAPTCTPPPPSA